MRLRLGVRMCLLSCLGVLLAGADGASAMETSGFHFACLDYDPHANVLMRSLISEFNEELGRTNETKALSIAAEPQRLTYYEVGRALSRKTPEIVFLSAMVFTDLQSTRGDLHYRPIRVLRSESRGSPDSTTYVGEVLVNPMTVDPETLDRTGTAKKEKLTCGRIRRSASGHLYFLDMLAQFLQRRMAGKGPLTRGMMAEDLVRGVRERGIAAMFKAVTARSHQDCLGLFFDHKNPVDIVPVWEGSIQSFLEAPVEGQATRLGWELVQEWAAKFAPDCRVNSAADARDLIETRCRWKLNGKLQETRPISSDVLAAKGDFPEAARAALAAVLDRVDADMSQFRAWCAGRGGVPRSDAELRRTVQGFVGERGVSTSVETLVAMAAFHRWGWGAAPEAELEEIGKLATFYSVARKWEELPVERGGATAYDVVRDISEDIGFRRRLEPTFRPRVAVVLSGGGASGCYQAGALRSFLGALARFDKDRKDNVPEVRGADEVHVSLFAGTSVGAINVVATLVAPMPAADSDSTGDPGDPMRDLWSRITGKRILVEESGETLWPWEAFLLGWVRKWPPGAVIFIVFIASLMTLYTFSVLKASTPLSMVHKVEAVPFASALVLAALAALGPLRLFTIAALGCGIAGVMASQLGRRAICRMVLWFCPLSGTIMALSLALHGVDRGRVAVWSVAATIIPLVVFAGRARWEAVDETPNPAVARPGVLLEAAWCFGLCVVMFGPLWMLDLLFNRSAVFSSSGLKQVLVEELARSPGVRGRLPAGVRLPDAGMVSSALASSIPPGVDVVITATELAKAARESVRPREVYFFRRARPAAGPAGRGRLPDQGPGGDPLIDPNGEILWSEIDGQEGLLVDMLVASASIFPGLPPHEIYIREGLADAGVKPRAARLIDGGFLHQIPIDAAVKFGATHIVVFKLQPDDGAGRGASSEDSSGERPGLGEDLLGVFNLLLERAQTSDLSAAAGPTVYSMAPKERCVGTFDFDGGRCEGDDSIVSLTRFYEMGRDAGRKPKPGEGFRLVSR